MTNNGYSLDANTGDRSFLIAAQLRLVQDIVSRLNANRVDTTEYACLKALVLFKPGTYTNSLEIEFHLCPFQLFCACVILKHKCVSH